MRRARAPRPAERWSAVLVLVLVLGLVIPACRTSSAQVPPGPGATGPPVGQPPPAQPSASTAPLAGSTWLVEDIDGHGVLEGVSSTMTIESDTRAVGSTGCNRYFAPLETAETALRFGIIGSTRRACPPSVMDQERRFVAALEATRAYRHEGDALLLLDEAGRIRVRLIRQAAETASPSRLAAHVFRCAEGPTFVLRPKGAGAADLVLGADVRRLAREPAASGAKYADDDLFVWNKGPEAILGVRNREYRCAEDRLASIREDARARGVEFRATGNEPGWLLEVQPDRIVFAGAGGEQAIVPRPAPAVDPAQGATTYAAATEAHRLRVRIEDGACADTMSGEQFGARVTVDLDGREYRGCGSALR